MKVESVTVLDERTLDALVELERILFERPLSREVLKAELQDRKHLLIHFAKQDQKVCGYKVGYSHSQDTFYSIFGGVIPECRGQGIARMLMEEQHRKAKELGYSYVRTHTKNKYREMLVLNIKSGFDVIGVYKKEREKHHGIILEKKL